MNKEIWFCNSLGQFYTLKRNDVLGLPSRNNLANGEGVLALEDVDVRRLVGDFHGKAGVLGIKGKRTIFLHHPRKEELDEWISDICKVAGTQEAAIPASA